MGAFNFENTGGGGPFRMFRGETSEDGSPVYYDAEYTDYVVPAEGKYTLQLTGFAEPLEVPIAEQFRKPDGPTNKIETKLELEILSDRGKGKRWICNYVTFSLGDRSNLFRIYVAAVLGGDAKAAPINRVYDDLLLKPFDAYVKVSEKRDDKGRPIRAMLAWDTIKPSGGAEEYDPFEDSEEVA